MMKCSISANYQAFYHITIKKKKDFSDSPVILYTLVYFHTKAPFDYTIDFL